MKQESIFNGAISNGKLMIDDRERMNDELKLIHDCEVEIIIRPKKRKRSYQQNAYYWAVVIPAIQNGIKQLGTRLTLNETEDWLIDFLLATDKEFTHLFLKERFISPSFIDESTGEIIERKKSSKQLSKEQFSEYLERVIQFANETLEIEIPESTNN